MFLQQKTSPTDQNREKSGDFEKSFHPLLPLSWSLPATKQNKIIFCRLHKRRTKSKEEKERSNIRNQKKTSSEDKENLAGAFSDKKLQSKDINPNSESLPTQDSNTELSDIRREVESQYLEDLKCPPEEDRESVASGGSATPNTARRRRIIDKNVKVTGPRDLNASELMRECEDQFPRLNYSYSEVTRSFFLEDLP